MGVIQKSRGGNVVLLHRDDSPNVFCRVRKPDVGGWLQRSTGTADIAEALRIAEEWHDEIRFKAKHGLALVSKAFNAVADLYVKELKGEVALGQRNERHIKDYVPIVERYFKDYFGNKLIDTIQTSDIAAYREWRAKYWIDGPGATEKFIFYERAGKTIKRPAQKPTAPSKQTINVENVVLRGIFNTALKHDHIKEHQLPGIPKIKQKQNFTKRRAAFTKAQYEKLSEFLHTWAHELPSRSYAEELENGPNLYVEEQKMRRWLLWNYFVFLVNSGLRPGTETDNLQWKHVEEIRTKRGLDRYKLTVTGKRGLRYPVVSLPACDRLVQIQTDNLKDGKLPGPDEYVFSLANGKHVRNDYFRQLFTKALKACELDGDNLGRPFSLYSCRHTYATNQLLRSVSVYTLAEQLGTSVNMIEQHYGHLTPELAADEITSGSVDDEYDWDKWKEQEAARQPKVKK
ncbi:MAG: site-specific integrase [Proteobacteria bacterium]|nr:site-specific integrase [Pseudomonadota bacterium]